MKRVSLKVKLTLLYTFFMLLLTGTALALMLSLSSREVLTSVQNKLESRVQECLDDIELQNGEVRVDSDFYSVTGDVYLALYDDKMYFMYGKVPYGIDRQPEISDGETRTIKDGGKEWYVYDLSFRLSADKTVYVRGITSVTDAEESFAVTIRFALIFLPLMVLATALIGYRFTRRTLLPVRTITATVRKIRQDADLSRRIGMKCGDEINTLAATFDEMLEELEKVFQREKQFTSDVSHELRTPISVIMAQCDELLDRDDMTKNQADAIRLIRQKAGRMADMISQLLFLSRADQGRQTLNKEQINLSELTEMIIEEQKLLSEAEKRGIRISWVISPDIYGYVDETFYIRILVNLISNARQYSRDGGKVEVRLEEAGSNVIVSVEDNGIGISEEDLPRIWERFYRGDRSRSGGGHSGLGLSMVKWMVEAHGGSISVESREGAGSRFVFSIPKDDRKTK